MKLYTIQRYKYDSMLKCPVCGREEIFENLVSYSSEDLYRDYMKCDSCGLVFSYPLTVPDYAESHFGDIAGHYNYECYVDIGAGIESMIRPLIPLLTNSITNINNFLDVGCGFGYCVKFASSLIGLKSVGYEPGEYGKIGSKVMNVKIINQYFQADSSKEKYDVIFSSEVIEHILNPVEYITTLSSSLKSQGIAVLTTPNTNYLYQCLEKNDDLDIKTLALLGPGQHLCLFNKQSMINLLEQCNISNYKIVEEDNNLIVYFSQKLDLASFNIPDKQEVRKYYLDFLNHLLNIDKTNRTEKLWSFIYRIIGYFTGHKKKEKLIARFCLGIAYRLMRENTNDRDFINADIIQNQYENFYFKAFNKTIYEALQSIDISDIEKCTSPLSILELFSQKQVSFNLYGFLFYKINLALNSGIDIQPSLSELIWVAKTSTDILDTLFTNLKNNPLALTWFGECFRLYPRFCFGLAILYLHANRELEALNLLDKLLVIIDEGYFEVDSMLRPDCLLQKAVIFLRKEDIPQLLSCTNILTTEYPEFSNSNELLFQLVNQVQELTI